MKTVFGFFKKLKYSSKKSYEKDLNIRIQKKKKKKIKKKNAVSVIVRFVAWDKNNILKNILLNRSLFFEFGLASLFNGISIFVCYFIPKLS